MILWAKFTVVSTSLTDDRWSLYHDFWCFTDNRRALCRDFWYIFTSLTDDRLTLYREFCSCPVFCHVLVIVCPVFVIVVSEFVFVVAVGQRSVEHSGGRPSDPSLCLPLHWHSCIVSSRYQLWSPPSRHSIHRGTRTIFSYSWQPIGSRIWDIDSYQNE